MYSLNSSSGASKSGAIQRILSFALPARQGQRVRSLRTSLANGCPCSAMTTSSPGDKREINSGNCSWACSKVTVDMAWRTHKEALLIVYHAQPLQAHRRQSKGPGSRGVNAAEGDSAEGRRPAVGGFGGVRRPAPNRGSKEPRRTPCDGISDPADEIPANLSTTAETRDVYRCFIGSGHFCAVCCLAI